MKVHALLFHTVRIPKPQRKAALQH